MLLDPSTPPLLPIITSIMLVDIIMTASMGWGRIVSLLSWWYTTHQVGLFLVGDENLRKLPFFGWFTLIDGVINKMKPIQYIIIISYTIKVICTGYAMLVMFVGPVNRHQGSSYLRKSGTYFVGYVDILTDFCAIQTPNIKRHTLIPLCNDISVALTCLHVCRWCNPH